MIRAIREGEHLNKPDSMTDEVFALVKKLLHDVPSARPLFQEIVDELQACKGAIAQA